MRRVASAVACLAMTLLPAPDAHACTCVAATIREYVAGADVVFAGTATASTRSPDGRAIEAFRVDRVYKGSVLRDVRVTTEGADCSPAFATGTRYLVFAYGSDGSYSTTACSGTSDDVASIDALRVPFTTPLAPKVFASGATRAATARTGPIAVALAAAIAASLALFRVGGGRLAPRR